MRTMAIGGTGLLGYHSVNHLLANGHDVTVLSLPPKPEGMFPDSVAIELGNLGEMSDNDRRCVGCLRDVGVRHQRADWSTVVHINPQVLQ